jgi:hypothetical protein
MENTVITHHPQPESVRALRKELLRVLLPDAQPAARMERLARSLGFASDAACTAHMHTTPHQPLNARRALELLENLGRGDPLGFVVETACAALYHDGTLDQWAKPKTLVDGLTAGNILTLASNDPAALRSKPLKKFEGVWPYPKDDHKQALQTGMMACGDLWQKAAVLEPGLRWFFACQTAYAVFPHGSALAVDDARRLWAYSLMLVPNFLSDIRTFGNLYTPLRHTRPANDVWAEQTQPWVYNAYRGLVDMVEAMDKDRGSVPTHMDTAFEAVRTVGAQLAQGRWVDVPQRKPTADLLGITL